MINRRNVTKGLVAASLAPLLARSAFAQSASLDGTTIRYATYGGYWQEQIQALVGVHLEEMGAKMEYITGTPRDHLAKLIAARNADAPFEVMELADDLRADIQRSGSLAKIDYDNIPNAKVLLANQREPDMVANYVTCECMVYNTEKFAEAGLEPPETFESLFDPKLQGHVSFPDLSYGNVNPLVGMAWEFGGGDESNIDGGFEAVKRLKPASFFTTSADLATQFRSGDIWVAFWHAGWAARLLRAGVPVATTFPKVKDKVGMISLGWLGIAGKTPNQAGAEKFIDLFLTKEAQETLCRESGIVPVNPDAAAALQDDPLLKKVMLLSPEQIDNTYYPDWSKINMTEWTRKWNEMVIE